MAGVGTVNLQEETMGQKITQVDAFTSERYRGNPAAICILESEADADWMQRVANEMNLSETAYIVRQADGFGLRWFTPTMEVDLCGHATVAAAHVLWQECEVHAGQPCRFHTRSGLLVATQHGSGWIHVEFPLEQVKPCEIPAGSEAALGVTAAAAACNDRLSYLVLELDSEAVVRAARPDFSAVEKLPFKGLIVTGRANAGSNRQVVSRFFAPRMGVNEDPATGSAHCVLGRYWAEKLGTRQFDAYQASARGAEIRVILGESSVILGGQAVTVLRGQLV